MTTAGGPKDGRRGRLRVGRFAIDLSPMRASRDFKILWIGLSVSDLGYQIALVGMFLQVSRLTRSPVKVGLIGLLSLVGLIVGSIAGGAVVDAYDRRTLLILSQIGFAFGAALLLGGAIAGEPSVWLIYGAAAIIGGVSAIDSPTRSAMTPRLVGTALVPSAVTLNQVSWNGVGLLGPALGGVIIQHLGLAWAYAVVLVTCGTTLFTTIMVAPMPPVRAETAEPPAIGWGAVKEGFAYVRDNRLLRSTFAIDLIAMIFGLPRALFAFLAFTQFHRGAQVVGLLFSAPALGALLGALTAGWVRHVERQGIAVVWAVIAWGAAIAAFGLVGDRLLLALIFLAIAGWADVISAIFRSTILQLNVPERLRGRLSGIHILVVTGGPRLGDLEAGLVAQVFTPTISVVSGGLACIVGAGLVAVRYPELRAYRTPAAT